MAAVSTVRANYKPRKQFLRFHSRSERFAVLVCHRRAGKTEAAIHDLVDKALRNPWQQTDRLHSNATPRYAYVAPLRSQAKDTVWTRLQGAVRHIKGCKISQSELSITLPNKAVIKIYGADDPDSLRGGYFDGVILDEYGDMKDSTYKEVIRLTLSDYKGWCVFIGTPKGKNNFYKRLQYAIEHPNSWYHMILKQSQSGILSAEEVNDYIEECDGDEDIVAQELECSFEAAIKGSYFGKQMVAIQEQGKIKPALPWVPSEPVSIAMDIGFADATAIWFWQVVAGEVRFIKYWEDNGKDADDIVEMLQLMPYSFESMWLPHDAFHHTFRSKKSVIDVFREADMPVKRVPNPDGGSSVMHGVNAVRKVLKSYPIAFDGLECKRGLESIRNYSHKWNPKTQVFLNEASHDQWSHGADAFRYACLSIKPEDLARSVDRAKAKAAIAQANAQSPINTESGVIQRMTLDEAFREREHQQRRNAMRGSPRI